MKFRLTGSREAMDKAEEKIRLEVTRSKQATKTKQWKEAQRRLGKIFPTGLTLSINYERPSDTVIMLYIIASGLEGRERLGKELVKRELKLKGVKVEVIDAKH